MQSKGAIRHRARSVSKKPENIQVPSGNTRHEAAPAIADSRVGVVPILRPGIANKINAGGYALVPEVRTRPANIYDFAGCPGTRRRAKCAENDEGY